MPRPSGRPLHPCTRTDRYARLVERTMSHVADTRRCVWHDGTRATTTRREELGYTLLCAFPLVPKKKRHRTSDHLALSRYLVKPISGATRLASCQLAKASAICPRGVSYPSSRSDAHVATAGCDAILRSSSRGPLYIQGCRNTTRHELVNLNKFAWSCEAAEHIPKEE